MKQRSFPFLAMLASPVDAPADVLAMCRNESDAIGVSIKHKGGYTDAWIAQRLGITPAYFCQIKKAARPVPAWLVKPFCTLTGLNLLQQYHDLQEALRLMAARNTQSDHEARMLRALKRAA